jgi:hypothetical protein
MPDETPPPPPRPPPSLPPSLEYASPNPDVLTAGRMVLQAVLGCTFTCGLLMGAVFFGILFSLTSNGSTPYVLVAISTGVLLLAAIIALAVRFQRQSRRRGWAMGIWLGIALSGLLEGLCLAQTML